MVWWFANQCAAEVHRLNCMKEYCEDGLVPVLWFWSDQPLRFVDK